MSSSSQRNENREPHTLNPRDRSGNILKCFNCNSVKHLVNKCPHPKDISNMRCHKCGLLGHLAFNCSEQKRDKVEESSPSPHVEYITLLNSKPDRMKVLLKLGQRKHTKFYIACRLYWNSTVKSHFFLKHNF